LTSKKYRFGGEDLSGPIRKIGDASVRSTLKGRQPHMRPAKRLDAKKPGDQLGQARCSKNTAHTALAHKTAPP
jgi:hypothetical protein